MAVALKCFLAKQRHVLAEKPHVHFAVTLRANDGTLIGEMRVRRERNAFAGESHFSASFFISAKASSFESKNRHGLILYPGQLAS
jgi:hypothetical protein